MRVTVCKNMQKVFSFRGVHTKDKKEREAMRDRMVNYFSDSPPKSIRKRDIIPIKSAILLKLQR